VADVRVRVPAKINLSLRVGPLRPDGFHELSTIFQAVSLVDDITVSSAPSGSGRTITVTGDQMESVPRDDGNLAARAAIAVARAAGIDSADVRIDIAKSIPVAGGMAGGSADAAATLIACRRLWNADLDDDALHALAADLGSDVPFALVGGTARGTGRGERLVPVLTTGEWHWVVALSHGELATPAVFAECDRLRAAGDIRSAPGDDTDLLLALRSASAHDLAPCLVNDLQPAALSLQPSLRRVLDAGDELGALAGIVSGSGPTCVFLARDREHAIGLAAEFAGSGLVRGVRHAVGPVRGAHLLP